MRKRIFRNMCLLALTAVVLGSLLLAAMVYMRSFGDMKEQAKRELSLISAGVRYGGEEYLQTLRQESGNVFRITHIQPDGRVLSDTGAVPSTMENHLARPEVQAALSNKAGGEAVRRSKTLNIVFYYRTVQLADGSVLRLATAMNGVFDTVVSLAPPMLFVAGVVMLLTLLLARRMADMIIGPLNALDLEHPESNEVYEELSPLLGRIAQQNRSIHHQMRQLTARQEEFRLLSENMKEGLLLLDKNAAILTINNSARQLLGGSPNISYVSQHFLQLSRDLALQQLIERALKGERAEDTLPLRGRQYQVIASPVIANEKMRGALLLFLDVTERREAEQLRQEFSANVSHELKTPLTSISGYAELLAGGMVKQEDTALFASRIYSEAGRLLSLIQDILKLSRLDEGGLHQAVEPVDLHTVVCKTVERLAELAAKCKVTITVSGSSAMVDGVPGMLEELVFNLCENAVKYNKPQGNVLICTEGGKDGSLLTVKDTGIGIPEGLYERVFERFYCIDKSRSKDTGGTGLGLSIVKHIAQIHGAVIQVDSKEQEGTCIRVRFPAAMEQKKECRF